MSAIGQGPLLDKVVAAGTLNPQPGGFYTLTINNLTKEVLSVQPDGSFQVRPQGTNGPYELCGLNGSVTSGGTLVFCPDGAHIYAYAWFPNVPNV